MALVKHRSCVFRFKWRRKAIFLAFCGLISTGYAVSQSPWLAPWMEWDFEGSYDYNFFNRVDNAVIPIEFTDHTQVISSRLGCTFLPNWDARVGMEFADTHGVSLGYRSACVDLRTRLLDDLSGDCVSFVAGLNYRNNSRRFKEALSTPYHGLNSLELTGSVGKEWGFSDLFIDAFLLCGIGQADSGFPWIRLEGNVQGEFAENHTLIGALIGYVGLGHQKIVDTVDFRGWASIAHRSIDLNLRYLYAIKPWAILQLQYSYRLFAQSYPEGVQAFELSVTIPFSLF